MYNNLFVDICQCTQCRSEIPDSKETFKMSPCLSDSLTRTSIFIEVEGFDT
jgi:hypothetical protein